MLKQKRILCVGLCISLLLGGCGGKKVQYDTVSEESSESDNEEKGKALKKELGIKEKKWKETISTEGEKQYINASIEVPNVSELMTMDVKEHYYTNEEKKELLEYFMEPGSIKVNKDAAETKEVLQKEQEILQEEIKNAKETNMNPGWIKALETELIRVEESLKHAGSKKELSPDVGNYEADDYYGKKREMEYYLSFQMNPEYNISKWELVGRKQQSETQDKWWYFNMMLNPYSLSSDAFKEKEKNTCGFSAGEAIKRAKKICSDLNLGNMQPYFIQGYDEDFDKPEEDGPEEYNGYIIKLSRAIGDYYVKPVHYDYYDYYSGGSAYRQNYGTERAVIVMTDAGITYMSYEGGMATGTEKKVENLLSMDKVQEVIREEMKKHPFQLKNTYHGLYLEYIRVKGEEPDSYSIIPAWRLFIDGGYMVSEEQYDDQEGNTQTCYRTEGMGGGETYATYCVPFDFALLINAIDGKRIDLDEEQILEGIAAYQEYKIESICN